MDNIKASTWDRATDEWNRNQRELNEELGDMDTDDGVVQRPMALGFFRAKLTGQMETSNGVAWTAEIVDTTPRHSDTIYVEQRGNGGSVFTWCEDKSLTDEFAQAAHLAFDLDPGERHLDDVTELATLFLLHVADTHAATKTR